MAGKNGSTKFTAPLAVEQATSGSEPLHKAKGTAECEQQSQGGDAPPRQTTMDSHDLKPPRGMLDRSLQAQLGRQLRSIFSDIADEPVPDRFVKLLQALEAKEKRR
jgi:hypothetical protein